jgi:hypothetical protein
MKQLNKLMQAQFDKMCATGKLFKSAIPGSEIWTLYLMSFENDPVFRDPESSTHNCNICHNFIRRYGNIVALDENYNIMTIFDVEAEDEYKEGCEEISKMIKKDKISDVFFETYEELNSMNYEKTNKTLTKFQLGIAENHKRYTKEEAEKFGVVKENEILTFNHFNIALPAEFVDKSGKSLASLLSEFRDAKNVFERAMEEIPLDTLMLVKDLINQGSLLDGTTHLYKIEQIIPLKKEYDSLSAAERKNWAWVASYKLPFAKFKNELVGVLCSDLAEGKELNEACQAWNKRVDPANYMKASAPITAKQIEEAKKFIEENGYEASFKRRFATMDDIKVSEILHASAGDGKIKTVSIFDGVKSTSTRHKKSEFDKVEEVPIDKFMKDILPGCTSIEAFLSNQHEQNMVTLTTADNIMSKPIFKWTNNYSWTFNGNLAGKSQLAEMVAAKGGRIDGAFRFTHSWNEIEPNQSLMDLHVFMPGCKLPKSGDGGPYVTGRRVGWNMRQDKASGGIQDVDYTDAAPTGYVPVENITFPDLSKMPEGVYTCAIHNWNFRGKGGKGRAEIAFNGEVYQYEYPATRNHQWVIIAEVTLKKGVFIIDHKLPEIGGAVSKEIYGLDSNQFHKVNLVCLSPNHWDGNKTGNKHFFFMLEGAKSPVSIRSFHNENLIPDLQAHRKVMEVLANTTMIDPVDEQLSGLGFNATVRDEVVLKLSGTHKRVIKVKF